MTLNPAIIPDTDILTLESALISEFHSINEWNSEICKTFGLFIQWL